MKSKPQDPIDRERFQDEHAQAILSQMPDGYWILDAKTTRVLEGNEAICRLLGYSRDELRQISALDVDATESRELVADRMQRALQSGSAQYETRYRRKDGTILEVEVSVTYLADRDILFGLHRDVTERKRVEAEMKRNDEALKRRNELFSSLLKLMPMGVFMIEAPSGKPLLANDAALTLLGRGILPDATSGNLAEVYQAHKPGSRDPYPLEEMPILLGMKGVKSHVDDILVERPDGTQALLEVFGSPVMDEQGRIWASLVSFIDITARKQAEDALTRLNAQLQTKNKELEQVVYVASHDLRSPLVNIEGYSREVEYAVEEFNRVLAAESMTVEALKAALTPTVQEMATSLRYIRNSAVQMDALLSGLLKLSRFGRAALTIVPLNMNELVARVMAATEFQITASGAAVEVAELPLCRGDAVQVAQVFTNLLSNALKYLEPSRPGRIRICGALEGQRAVYSVEDNGIGIAPAHQENIFEIFHRLDPTKSQGEGLGLAIVRQAVGRLAGEVRVESQPGVGSRFYVALPAVHT